MPEKLPTREQIPDGLAEELRSTIELTFSKDPFARERACKTLGNMGENAAPAIPFLIGLLTDHGATSLHKSGDFYMTVDRSASSALVAIGKPAVQPCIDALAWSEDSLLLSLIYILAESRDPRAIAPLCCLLNDRNPKVRGWSTSALSYWPDPQFVPLLLAALKDDIPELRSDAASSLGMFRGNEVVGSLINSLGDEDSGVRNAAVRSLKNHKDQNSVPALMKVMVTPTEDEWVRYYAAEAIAVIGEPKSIDQLFVLLQDQTLAERVKCGIVRGFEEANNSRFVNPLTEIVQDRRHPSKLRAAAVEAITTLVGKKVVPFLKDVALKSDDDRVRCVAAIELEQLTEETFDQVELLDALSGPYSTNRKSLWPGDAWGLKKSILQKNSEKGKTEEVRNRAKECMENGFSQKK